MTPSRDCNENYDALADNVVFSNFIHTGHAHTKPTNGARHELGVKPPKCRCAPTVKHTGQ